MSKRSVPVEHLTAALNYIKHCGANAIMRGQPHPQQQIVDWLEHALAAPEQPATNTIAEYKRLLRNLLLLHLDHQCIGEGGYCAVCEARDAVSAPEPIATGQVMQGSNGAGAIPEREPVSATPNADAQHSTASRQGRILTASSQEDVGQGDAALSAPNVNDGEFGMPTEHRKGGDANETGKARSGNLAPEGRDSVTNAPAAPDDVKEIKKMIIERFDYKIPDAARAAVKKEKA